MSLVKLTKQNNVKIIKTAVNTLNMGGIIAYPTETFYALGAKYDDEAALMRLYKIKERPIEKALPLIIHTQTLLSLLTSSKTNTAKILMKKFWPGPLTLVFSGKDSLSNYITAGTASVAVRIPGKSFALLFSRAMNVPITATSANPSGMPPAQDANTVLRYFGKKIDLIIDGGKTPGGLPSTIVDVTGEKIIILREGIIPKEKVISALKD